MSAQEDFDPEMLSPGEKIRYAEDLMRSQHRVLDDDWMFWGSLADYLNEASHIPDRTGNAGRDWRRLNNAQNIATGYIRMAHAR